MPLVGFHQRLELGLPWRAEKPGTAMAGLGADDVDAPGARPQAYSFLKYGARPVPVLDIMVLQSDGDAREHAVGLLRSDERYQSVEVLAGGAFVVIVDRSEIPSA